MTIAFRTKEESMNAFDVEADNDVFLRPEENTFLFFLPGMAKITLLHGKRESYQQGTIDFNSLALVATDLLGRRCAQCGEVVQEITNAGLHLTRGQVKSVIHETCFADWFVKVNKASITPYRFVRPRKRKLTTEGSSFKIRLSPGGEQLEELAFTALRTIQFEEIKTREALSPSAAADSKAQPGFTGTPPQGVSQDEYFLALQKQGLVPEDGAGGAKGAVTVVCPHCSRPLVVEITLRK